MIKSIIKIWVNFCLYKSLIWPQGQSASDSEKKLHDENSTTDRRLGESKEIEASSQADISNNKPQNQKKEITIDQSPLEEVNFQEEVSNRENNLQQDDQASSAVENDTTKPNLKLKLEICEQYKTNNFVNLSRNFKLLLDDIILSCSPFVKFQLPFLMRENNEDTLRVYLPDSYMNYLKSNILSQESHSSANFSEHYAKHETNADKTDVLHEFLLMHLTKSFDDDLFKKMYADYKSRGGIAATSAPKRLILRHVEKIVNTDENMGGIAATKKSTAVQAATSGGQTISRKKPFDCLNIFNRQHLAVLFYSQCESSPVFPNICNKPRIIDMKFYCENDMTLGKLSVFAFE